ncbi:hypothetical protein MKX01_011596 [Papaver californicum]|nr:hypothetical protein MKX01_011596 [Papaver californicum]
MDSPTSDSSSCNWGELECIGKLEIVRPKPVGFLCGTLPVPTDESFNHVFNSALIPSSSTSSSSSQTVKAPRYRMLPTETDLNTQPLLPNLHEKNFPLAAVQSKASSSSSGDFNRESSVASQNLTRKSEALAVYGLSEYGDEIDVIAPTDILKQIFNTLVLNAGPDIEEGERLVRRHSSQSKSVDQSLFLNFAMHSVRAEACDVPPSGGHSNTSILPGSETRKDVYVSSDLPAQGDRSQYLRGDDSQNEGLNCCSDYPQVNRDKYWGSKQSKTTNKHHAIKKSSQVGEKLRHPIEESEKYRRVGNDSFLRVLFWQFHNFRVLLGSDLLRYELLKTDDIFLLKGISEDGTPAFHPQVVQQNGLSVFRFLQDNCKQDPGAYWLYKSAGEDDIQLFDLSAIPKNHSPDDQDASSGSLPSLMHGRRDSLFSLGTLLYRLAHRLSLSVAPSSRAKCAKFFRKCLDFLDEQDHLVVRACAHEQFARLILKCYEELDLTSEFLPLESEVTVTNAEEESHEFSLALPGSVLHFKLSCVEDGYSHQDSESDGVRSKTIVGASSSAPGKFLVSRGMEITDPRGADCKVLNFFPCGPTVADPISSKLAAVHHVSQAIKSLRWKRQLQKSEADLVDHGKQTQDRSAHGHFSVCACGDSDCIEVCDLREWLPKSKMDHKLWKLVLLLGESYLALGQAYKEDGQLQQTLKVVGIACSVYGSMPQHVEDAQFISSMVSSSGKTITLMDDKTHSNLSSDSVDSQGSPSTYLFWAKAWTLVGDVYVEYHLQRNRDLSAPPEAKVSPRGVRMSSDVVKEVKRLKKKLGQFKQNCSTCSLINCSCQSDRAGSGNSASSSSGNSSSLDYGKKKKKKAHVKEVIGSPENIRRRRQLDNSDGDCLVTTNKDTEVQDSDTTKTKLEETSPASKSIVDDVGCEIASEAIPSEMPNKGRTGGIFVFLGSHIVGDADDNLSVSVSCYDEAKKALGGIPIGWVCNELGRNRLDRKELDKAELAVADAIEAFKQVADHTNIILINCNMGHGRRALAEEMVSKMEIFKAHMLSQDSYKQALDTAKLEYRKAIRYYEAAAFELEMVGVETGLGALSTSLKNEVYAQFANTYLRLGMLLAKEDIVQKKHEISANGAIREALRMYELLGELRKQEAAYAYFHKLPSCGSSIMQKVKQYVSLAEWSWQKSISFYGPKTHPVMYLTVLIERSALSWKLSESIHSIMNLELALSRLFEGRHIYGEQAADLSINESSEVYSNFRDQLQALLKKMLQVSLSANANKSCCGPSHATPINGSLDAVKLRRLYGMALKMTNLSQLLPMYDPWSS